MRRLRARHHRARPAAARCRWLDDHRRGCACSPLRPPSSSPRYSTPTTIPVADAVLPKPFTGDQVRAIVERLREGASRCRLRTARCAPSSPTTTPTSARSWRSPRSWPASTSSSVVSDGRAALEVIERGGIDLAILDVSMPEMSGLEVLASIRGSRPRTEPRVVIVSASVDDASLAAGTGVGRRRLRDQAVQPAKVRRSA